MASSQQNLAGKAAGQAAEKFLKRQWWKLLVEAVPLLGDVSPTFSIIVFSELREREKNGGQGVTSAEGVIIMFLAVMNDMAGWGALALDGLFGIGFIVSPVIAVSGYATIGLWMLFSKGGPSPQEQDG
ncbi:MAG: hypothetical protein PHU56_00385 [Candidatus Pacebacteria bacterium]|nr:hypothetical protein [Candidatus Paceibacterota bacterium]